MQRRVAVGISLCLLLGTVALGQANSAAPGDSAPAFATEDVRGEERSVRSQELLPGKITLLSFFATWCRPCRAEIPIFNSLVERYEDRGFQVVLISLDRDKQDVQGYLRTAEAARLTALWDGKRETKAPYGVSQLPTNVLIDPDGTIAELWSGDVPERLHALGTYLEGLPKRRP